MVEWVKCTVGDVVTLHYGKGLPASKRINGDIPVYSSAGLTGRHNKALVETEGLIIGRKGTIGKVYKAKKPFFAIDTTYFIKPDVEKYHLNFLFYFFQQIGLEDLNEDSAVPGLNRNTIYSQEIYFPPLVEQKAIAEVLSSLDDKIDLLHRQNKTLEALAETLFRQWFVEEASEDWEDVNLGFFAENPRVSVRPVNVKEGTKYIGLEHIDRKSIALTQSGSACDVISNKYQFIENDILFGKLRPYFHKICFAPHDGVCSTDILVIRPKKPEYFTYCLFAFYQSDVVEYANIGSGGTRMPRTNWDSLRQYPAQKPDDGKLKLFNQLISSYVEKIKKNINQAHTLERFRDTLLPKLMSGEGRVNT